MPHHPRSDRGQLIGTLPGAGPGERLRSVELADAFDDCLLEVGADRAAGRRERHHHIDPPGLGLLEFQAINSKDFPMLQGAFLVFSVAVIVLNLIADCLYFVLDPRVKTA